jgi:Ribosomal protein S17
MKKIGVILNKSKFNTATVFIKELRKQKKYKINYFKIKKLRVETNSLPIEIGDIVEIQQTRPLSKTKNNIITRILLK